MPARAIRCWVKSLIVNENIGSIERQKWIHIPIYGRRFRSHTGWLDVGEVGLIGPELVHKAMEKV